MFGLSQMDDAANFVSFCRSQQRDSLIQNLHVSGRLSMLFMFVVILFRSSNREAERTEDECSNNEEWLIHLLIFHDELTCETAERCD